MALAETARLIASLELKDKGFASGVAKAEGQVNKLDKTTSKIGGSSKGFAGLTKSAGGLGRAFGNAGKAASGLLSSIGPLLGVGGALGIGALFASSISKAEEFSQSIRKVQAITGESAEATSAYVDVLDKYGVGADKVAKLTGILEKNLGTIGKTAKTAAKFQADYGINVLDASGHVASATEVFKRAVAFFNSNATASQKAAALNKLYGKSWQDLIPALREGTGTIKKEFGTALQLGDAQLKNLDKFKAAQREFADEFGDLQVIVGTEILPALIGPMKEFTSFLSSHRGDIVNFIKGGISAAKEFGGALKDFVIPAGKAIVDAFNAIPPDIRKLLIGGAIANKVLKVTFGFDPLKIVGSGIGEAVSKGLGGIFQRGSPANPMFTKEVGIAGAAGGVGAGGGGSGLLNKGIGILTILGSALAVIGTQQQISQNSSQQAADVAATQKEWLAKSPKREDLINGLAGVEQGIRDLESNPLNVLVQGDALDKLRQMREDLKAQLFAQQQAGKGFTGLEGRGTGFRPEDAIGNRLLGQTTTASAATLAKLDQLHKDFLDQRALLKSGTDAQKAAAAAAIAKDVQKGVGNVSTTKDLAAQLRATALTVKDPELRKQINAAAARVEGKIQGREWIATQKAAAAKIARSNEATGQKIRELKTIQQSLIAHGDTAAARIVGALLSGVVPAINSLKNGINVNLPGVLPRTSPTRPRNQNTPDTPVAPRRNPRQVPGRGGVPETLIKITTSHRDNSGAKVIRNRIGGTPADVGAI